MKPLSLSELRAMINRTHDPVFRKTLEGWLSRKEFHLNPTIRLGYNAVPKSAEKEILNVLRSGQFSPGPRVREFEERWASLHGAKHAVFVNSGTDALRLSLLAMKEKYGWPDGSLVAVTTQTFVATINVILQSNLTPYFYDAGNPWNLEHKLECSSQKVSIKAVVPVHLYGNLCEPFTFELAVKNKWKVLEDSCERVLNKIRGDVGCYSTYMAHHVTTGVGGFAVTNDMDLNLLIRSYANHGRSASYLPGYFMPDLGPNLLASRFRFDRIGYSSRGTEFEAALGLSQLDDLPKQIEKRREVAMEISRILDPYWLDFKFDDPVLYPDHTYMMYPILIKEDSKIKKEDLCLYLEKNGIETRDMMPITNQPCYRDLIKEYDYPASRQINKNGFYIACHPGIGREDILHIRKTFNQYCKTKK